MLNMAAITSTPNRFDELSLGMNKSEVTAIMGKPFQSNIKQSNEGSSYEVIYYFLPSADIDGSKKYTLTPVILKNNVVKGLGLTDYNNLIGK